VEIMKNFKNFVNVFVFSGVSSLLIFMSPRKRELKESDGSGPGRLIGSGPGRLIGSGPGRLIGSGPGRLIGSGPGHV